ncbi:hypothetical protein M5689_009179 [Euphorbia peplus]|nr:hypothetical protein M5689_009179 [Euphorbia peplus]
MDTELQRLPLINETRSCSIISSSSSLGEHEEQNSHRYTSLKDIIVNSSQNLAASSTAETYDLIDPSNIMIRNQLVKHAASAYLQSAAVLVSRNQNWFMRFWEKLKFRVSNVCDPLTAIYRSLQYLVGGAFIR